MRDFAEWYSKGSETIFEGQVVRQDFKDKMGKTLHPPPWPSTSVVVFRALHVYRGEKKQTYVLQAYEIGFKAGEKYLVYASANADGTLATNNCDGTRLLEEAGPDVRYLRGEAPLPEDLLDSSGHYQLMSRKLRGIICGQVARPGGGPLENAEVRLLPIGDGTEAGESASATSGTDGSYCIEAIPPGKYLLSAQKKDSSTQVDFKGYFPGVRNRSDATTIDVNAGVTQTGLDFETRRSSLVAVRFWIRTSDGSPAPWEHLGVSLESPTGSTPLSHKECKVEADWSCSMSGIPTSRYTVSVSFMKELKSGQEPPEAGMWKSVRKEIEISTPEEFTLELVRKP